MTYRREIDGLRAVAVLSVIFYHANFLSFQAGFIGVDVFFVISGYLISSLILKDLESNSFSLIQFYERRARRILPALFLVMLCCIPFAWIWLMPLELSMFAKSLVAVCLFSSNFLFWKETGYFEPANELKPLLHTWSLAVEEQFYLIFPLLFLLAWKWKKRGLFLLILFGSAISLTLMQWGTLNSPDANYYLLPGRAWEFLLGMLITLIIYPVQKKTETLPAFLPELAAATGITLLIYSLFNFNRYESFPSFFALIPLLGTALIILFATPTTLTGKLLSSPPLVGIGLISYSGYLWHQPLFAFARHAMLKEPPPWIFTVLIAINFLLSYLSWKFVEQPFRSNKIFSRKQILVILGAVSSILISLGTIGLIHKSFRTRFGNQFFDIEALLKDAQQGQVSIPASNRPQYTSDHLKREKSVSLFVDTWKKNMAQSSSLKALPIAIFGSSLAADIYTSFERLGYKTVGLFGSACSINPHYMQPFCLELAHHFMEYVKTRKDLKYLVLYTRLASDSELSIDFFEGVFEFWKPLNLRLIIFSQKPEFSFFKEQLQRGQYPLPDLKYSELSLREPLMKWMETQNIYLVNSKDIFCKISGNCDFKLGSRKSFKPEDFIYSDGYHLTATGQREFGRILLENDPLFKQIISDFRNSTTSQSPE